MSHRGSLLFLPTGVWGWPITSAEDLEPGHFVKVIEGTQLPEFVLLGCGSTRVNPTLEIMQAFSRSGVGLDAMDTGAAARTYNILLAEGRHVGAALIAVD